MNILFLSVSTGEGHIKAADALNSYIKSRIPGVKSLVVDAYKYISPTVDRLIVGSYLNMLKYRPQIYGHLYRISKSDRIAALSKKINGLLSLKLNKLIEEFKPSIIICTHAFPLQMVSFLKQQGRINVPVAAVVTDFADHIFWKHENVDAYIVAHDHVKQDMARHGIPQSRIHTFGIPVSEKFLRKSSRQEALKELGFKDLPTVLIMGGSLGLGHMEKVFGALLNLGEQLQIIAVAGKNKQLKKQFESLAGSSDGNVRIYGYANNIDRLMDASDVIITKPGGMTVSEALVKNLPMILLSPVPGQEEENLHFLVNSGAAVWINPGDRIGLALSRIIFDSQLLEQMGQMAVKLSFPGSCRKISEFFIELAQKRKAMN